MARSFKERVADIDSEIIASEEAVQRERELERAKEIEKSQEENAQRVRIQAEAEISRARAIRTFRSEYLEIYKAVMMFAANEGGWDPANSSFQELFEKSIGIGNGFVKAYLGKTRLTYGVDNEGCSDYDDVDSYIIIRITRSGFYLEFADGEDPSRPQSQFKMSVNYSTQGELLDVLARLFVDRRREY